ncbi:MAG TPA: glycosyltransferase [Acidimicrobiales bacterium]|nr:glycosyltransferase [Acidimicrobiales bacterium]
MTGPGGRRFRILALCFDPVTEQMPGPAIRAWNLAEQLAGEHDVVLAGTAGATRRHPAFEVRAVTGGEIDALVEWADVVFAPTSVVRRHPVVAASETPLCIDMYVPTHLENLEAVGRAGDDAHRAAVAHQVSVINEDLRAGDFFLCASERQRDFWLGSLATLGRVNPATYGRDPRLRDLIDVVPFGIEDHPPAGQPGVLRREFPAIGPQDPVVIWGGGVYNWFDPVSLVRAIDALKVQRPAIRMVFLGMRHPNPEIPEMRVAQELRDESDRLGLTGRHVFFNEGWVPYDQRAAYLLDADVAASTHLAHLETRFSFRTRVLDYLWAGLPAVLTEGDTLSDEVAAAGLGVAVPPGDPAAIAAAIARLLDSPPERSEVAAFGERFRWSRAAGPLLEFCRSPRRAADRPARPPAAPGAVGGGGPAGAPPPPAPGVAPGPAAGPGTGPQPRGSLRTAEQLARRFGRPLGRVLGPRGRQALRRLADRVGRPAGQ